ncbi:MarR family winged helix-turn-helix transcriptional regulator [Bacillus sp. EB600]|uniref:MarR family winged helix-turn-helix transcriptional regulator n=1 Tax=Bacillus sp. EB600 TaxID=2806345 RepID=UPI00210DB3ED|nr:winged helix DNA-binding protein [Bacillus sp. EB600]MCQ6281639.1 winged helix DNA-binding protein [Bacillus sp. EB600]
MQGFFQCFLALYRPLISQLNELLSEYELSYSLWQVIFYLKNNGTSALIDISNYYNVEKPSITRRVQRLEKMCIVKEIPGQDKREKIIQLTDVGEEIYQSCRQKITELEYSVMKDTSKEEQMAAFRLLPKMKKNILEGE